MLVLGKILATLSEAIVPLAIVRLLGKADVGILSGLLLVYSTVALVLTAGFPETLTFYLPTRTPAERKAIAGKVAQALLLLGFLGALVLVAISLARALRAELGERHGIRTRLPSPASRALNTWLCWPSTRLRICRGACCRIC